MPGTSNHKIAMINAMLNYFQTIVQKPTCKKYSSYGVLTGSQARVYATWEEVKMVVLGSDKNASYKGFYSLEEAFTTIRTSASPNYFIRTLLKGKSAITTQDKAYSEVVSIREKEEG